MADLKRNLENVDWVKVGKYVLGASASAFAVYLFYNSFIRKTTYTAGNLKSKHLESEDEIVRTDTATDGATYVFKNENSNKELQRKLEEDAIRSKKEEESEMFATKHLIVKEEEKLNRAPRDQHPVSNQIESPKVKKQTSKVEQIENKQPEPSSISTDKSSTSTTKTQNYTDVDDMNATKSTRSVKSEATTEDYSTIVEHDERTNKELLDSVLEQEEDLINNDELRSDIVEEDEESIDEEAAKYIIKDDEFDEDIKQLKEGFENEVIDLAESIQSIQTTASDEQVEENDLGSKKNKTYEEIENELDNIKLIENRHIAAVVKRLKYIAVNKMGSKKQIDLIYKIGRAMEILHEDEDEVPSLNDDAEFLGNRLEDTESLSFFADQLEESYKSGTYMDLGDLKIQIKPEGKELLALSHHINKHVRHIFSKFIQEDSKDLSSWSQYEDKSNGLSLKYPKEWVLASFKEANKVLLESEAEEGGIIESEFIFSLNDNARTSEVMPRVQITKFEDEKDIQNENLEKKAEEFLESKLIGTLQDLGMTQQFKNDFNVKSEVSGDLTGIYSRYKGIDTDAYVAIVFEPSTKRRYAIYLFVPTDVEKFLKNYNFSWVSLLEDILKTVEIVKT